VAPASPLVRTLDVGERSDGNLDGVDVVYVARPVDGEAVRALVDVGVVTGLDLTQGEGTDGGSNSPSPDEVADFLAVLAHAPTGFVARARSADDVLAVLAATVAALRGDDVRAAWTYPDVAGLAGLRPAAATAVREVLLGVEVADVMGVAAGLAALGGADGRDGKWQDCVGGLRNLGDVPRIAYFGPSGTFTEMALAEFEAGGAFEGQVDRVAAESQAAALDLVRAGEVDGAVVPIESSVEGSIPSTLDSLATGPRLQIMAEVELDIAFTIVARPGTTSASVRSVAAYPVAAAQVRHWIAQNLPQARVQFSASNAAAAEDVAAGHADAGVATALAGERMGLIALADGVADHDAAVTRFVLVTRPGVAPVPTGADRTSVVLGLSNEPGSLMRAFAEFATRGIDLTRIESRPTRARKGTYRFFIDCVGHVDDPAVAEALKALYRTAIVRYLGSWPASSPTGTPPPSDAEAAQWLADLRKGLADP
jgi:prephenate dehydratase